MNVAMGNMSQEILLRLAPKIERLDVYPPIREISELKQQRVEESGTPLADTDVLIRDATSVSVTSPTVATFNSVGEMRGNMQVSQQNNLNHFMDALNATREKGLELPERGGILDAKA